jgi:hypothetical protein
MRKLEEYIESNSTSGEDLVTSIGNIIWIKADFVLEGEEKTINVDGFFTVNDLRMIANYLEGKKEK